MKNGILLGKTKNGEEVYSYKICNKTKELQAEIISYGAIIKNLYVKDRNGVMEDVVLGQDSMEAYLQNPFCSGAFIGRVANRIGSATFSVGAKKYFLEPNDEGNCLHSGSGIYAGKNFKMLDYGDEHVVLFLLDNGEGGFPGSVKVIVTYEVTEENELNIHYMAIPSEDTPINYTNHVYFNIGGEKCPSIMSHLVQINADFYTEADENNLPTGNIVRVEGTPLDFRKPVALCDRMRELQITNPKRAGFDHNFVLKDRKQAACVYDPVCGRGMRVFTDQPGMQFYTANHFDGKSSGKGGICYQKHSAYCFETQAFPNAVNLAHFPNVIVHGGELWQSTTTYQFFTD